MKKTNRLSLYLYFKNVVFDERIVWDKNLKKENILKNMMYLHGIGGILALCLFMYLFTETQSIKCFNFSLKKFCLFSSLINYLAWLLCFLVMLLNILLSVFYFPIEYGRLYLDMKNNKKTFFLYLLITPQWFIFCCFGQNRKCIIFILWSLVHMQK